MRQKGKSLSRVCSTFVPKIDSFENNDKQFIKFIINLNTVIMRIFTKSLIAFALLCIAGVVNARLLESTIKTVDFSDPSTYNANRWGQFPEGSGIVYEEGCMVLSNTSTDGDFFSLQFWAAEGLAFQAGATYEVKITYKFEDGDDDPTNNSIWMKIGDWGGGPTHYGVPFEASDVFITKTETFEGYDATRSNAFLLWQSRGVLGTFKVSKIEIIEKREVIDPAPEGKMYDPSYLIIHSGDVKANHWEQQITCQLPQALAPEGKYTLTVSLKAANPGENCGVEAWADGGGATMYSGQFVYPTSEFADYTWTFTNNGNAHNQIKLTCGLINGDLYIDNVTLKEEGSDEELIYDGNFYSDGSLSWSGPGLELVRGELISDPDYRPETAVSVDVEINDTDPAIVAKKVALLSAINRGKDADRTNKTKASMKALDDAITEGYKLFAPEAQKKKVTVQIPGEDEKKDLTFSTAEYCAAQWDATAQTLTWGQGGWNAAWTFMSADGVSGDLSEWTKLHLKVSDFTNSKENKLKVVFQENDGNMPPAGAKAEGELVPDADGNIDLDLAGFNWGSCPKNNIADMTIYGLERTDETAAASVKVTEAWLAKPTYKEEEQTVDKTQAEILAELTAAAQAIRSAIIDLEDRPAPAAEAEVPAGWKSVITNGTLESNDMSSFFIVEPDGEGLRQAVREDYAGKDDHYAAVVRSKDNPATDWDAQIFFKANEMIPVGKKIHVEFDYRSDVAGQADTQCHNQPTQYIHWACVGSPNFTTEWQHYKYDTTVPNECNGTTADGGYLKNFQTIAFNLSKNKKATTFYIDNVIFWVEDDATIINSVDAKAAGKGEYFDLQGRRVAKPGKGLYILNGRKIAIK